MRKRILLGASYSVIEPLGLLHLGGLARDMGWEREYELVRDHDFEPFFEKVEAFRPDLIGFNVYTGNHLQLHHAMGRIRKDHPNIPVVLGGPHATYFPVESLEIADFVVMSEGFHAFAGILSGTATPGVIPMQTSVRFPMPDRIRFYECSPGHAASRIKSVITMTGCPYTCTYCYNSSVPTDLTDVTPDIAVLIAERMGKSGRLFPKNVRPVEDVVAEGREIVEQWPTDLVYFQDDVHGFDIKNWMSEFRDQWKDQVSLPYHAQMRWEMTHGTSGDERLDLLKDAGCFGLTFAIEAANATIRDEVLNRKMTDELVFEGMQKLVDRGLKVRTEQITALPYGATSVWTPVNLDADLELVELNVRLKEQTGGPTMAWASTLAPYRGTKLGAYCERYGYYVGDNSDVEDSFFERSVMRFPREWVGPSLEGADESVWLSDEELETYRDQNAELRRHFNFFCLVPGGHILARDYVEAGDYSYPALEMAVVVHLKSLPIEQIRDTLACMLSVRHKLATRKDGSLQSLAPYLAMIPESGLAARKVLEYVDVSDEGLTPHVLSTAIRHHLYDNVLYVI